MADRLRSPRRVEKFLYGALRKGGIARSTARALARAHAPHASHAMRVRGIGGHGDAATRRREVLYFLAQAMHETGGLRWLAEFWGPTAAQRSYVGRMGNRSLAEAYRYRGGGVFQLTGRDNFRLYASVIGVDIYNHPERARAPKTAWLIAATYWRRSGCDRPARGGDFIAVTRLINGGTNGLAERRVWLHRLERS